MQYLRLALDVPPERRHPMHRFAMEHGEYGAYWLLHWQTAPGEPSAGSAQRTITALFYVAGPVEPYVDALAERTPTATHSVTEASGDGFYLYAGSRLDDAERRFVDAVAPEGVLVVPPVEYRMDGTMALSLVGPQAVLTSAIDALPDDVATTVLELGPYERRSFPAAGEFTERQREVVAAAADLGYYEEPREATVDDVAAATDCAPSTAAEHLRKAEAAVMERAASGPVAPAARVPAVRPSDAR